MKSSEFKLLIVIGGLFHLIISLLYDVTIYNKRLFWIGLIISGVLGGLYLIKRLGLLDSNNSKKKKKKKKKKKAPVLLISMIMLIGGILLFGNVINGIVYGINYVGKGTELKTEEYKIDHIIKHSTRTRRSFFRKKHPLIYFIDGNEIYSLELGEKYNEEINYEEYQTVEFEYVEGLLGFKIVESYELNK